MASRRILKDTVTLYNYIGEVNDIATYQETTIEVCYCVIEEGKEKSLHAKKPAETARLYIFDFKSVAKAEDGTIRSYLPYREWIALEDKLPYWTLNDNGDDFFEKPGMYKRFNVAKFSHKDTGTRRMWHFEVDGK